MGDAKLVIHDEVRVLEAIIGLLSGLLLIALSLVVTISIVGSTVAALCAVGRGNSNVSKQTALLASRSSQHEHFEKQNAVHNK